jgi:hypothetical protein
MPKLSRKTHRVFAGEAPVQGNIAQFGSEAAGTPNFTGDPEQIQALAAWGAGWGGAVVRNKVPPMQDMNALQYAFSYQLAYLLQMGVPEWNEDQEYYRNSFCQSGGLLYVSKLDGNVRRAVTDTNYWRLFITTGSGPSSSRPASAPTEYQYYDTDLGVWLHFRSGMWQVMGGVIGELRMFMQRKESLPHGWYYPDSRLVDIDSELGRVLLALPANLRDDWGVTFAAGGRLRMFNNALFTALDSTGARVGRHPRFISWGTSILPGGITNDAIRNITGYLAAQGSSTRYSGEVVPDSTGHANGTGGAIDRDTTRWWDNSSQGGSDGYGATFDASRIVPVANENRPFGLYVTPGIFLGVVGQPSYVAP